MAVHDVAKDWLHHVAGDGQHHDQKAAECQGDAELRHDDRQKDGQEVAVEIIEEMAGAEKQRTVFLLSQLDIFG